MAQGSRWGGRAKKHAHVSKSKMTTKNNLLGLAAVLLYLSGLHSTGHLKSVWLPIKTATILAH